MVARQAQDGEFANFIVRSRIVSFRVLCNNTGKVIVHYAVKYKILPTGHTGNCRSENWKCRIKKNIYIHRVIHKSLRDFRPLWYRSRDGHAEGEHVNRGRDTPSFCPTLQVLDMLTFEGSWQTFLTHARQSRPMAPAGLFVSQRTGGHSAGISCTTHELFCP